MPDGIDSTEEDEGFASIYDYGTTWTEEELAAPLEGDEAEEESETEVHIRIGGDLEMQSALQDERQRAIAEGSITPDEALSKVRSYLREAELESGVKSALKAKLTDLELPLADDHVLKTTAATDVAIMAQRIEQARLEAFPRDPYSEVTTTRRRADGRYESVTKDVHGRVFTETFDGEPAGKLVELPGGWIQVGGPDSILDRDLETITREDLASAPNEEYLAFREREPGIVQQLLDEEADAMDAAALAKGHGRR